MFLCPLVGQIKTKICPSKEPDNGIIGVPVLPKQKYACRMTGIDKKRLYMIEEFLNKKQR